jgi:hypothetical protein
MQKAETHASAEALARAAQEIPPFCTLKMIESFAQRNYIQVPSSNTNEEKRKFVLVQYVMRSVKRARAAFVRGRDKDFILDNSIPFRILYWFFSTNAIAADDKSSEVCAEQIAELLELAEAGLDDGDDDKMEIT